MNIISSENPSHPILTLNPSPYMSKYFLTGFSPRGTFHVRVVGLESRRVKLFQSVKLKLHFGFEWKKKIRKGKSKYN